MVRLDDPRTPEWYMKNLTPVTRALRIERCIRHEMTHGGDTFAQAKAIVRDARLGYLVFPGVIRNPS